MLLEDGEVEGCVRTEGESGLGSAGLGVLVGSGERRLGRGWRRFCMVGWSRHDIVSGEVAF